MNKQIIVGGSLRDAVSRVADAWNASLRGETREATDTITFANWSALSAVLTDKRHALLRHLHERPAESIRELARSLGRDFKRVHEDVTALEQVGLIERDGSNRLTASYGQIQATILIEDKAA